MSSAVNKLIEEKLLKNPPKWMKDNICLEVITGSFAYGVSSDTSDMDVVGFVIPPKDIIFPHLAGGIIGFGEQPEEFGQFSQHHIFSKENNKEYDVTIYNIVKFFNLCMQNNPNMVDVLFSPVNCVLHMNEIGQLLRDNRKMFLHKGVYNKFRGYAFQSLTKLENGANKTNPKRRESIKKYGMDVKHAYHIIRLLLQVEQILVEGDLDLRRNIEVLKSIRNGEWSIERIKKFFETKESYLVVLYQNSKLPYEADEEKIKALLIQCLEIHYGNLDKAVSVENNYDAMGREIRETMERYGI
ncbi:MAG: nucleotidyltransferase [Hyphomicrobiales bacterium]|nr:MAG: nucleotidyltransferase [Hyphomicrobiales bacterium]PCJ96841.1 MAG: nucleotidyltransferase [Hyphomicrobiales bacterium]